MSAVFLKLVNLSIAASWLILAVILLRFLLKKAPKWISCMFWGLAAVRLMLPFSLESALSLLPRREVISLPKAAVDSPGINLGGSAMEEASHPAAAQSLALAPDTGAKPLQLVFLILAAVWFAGMIALLAYALISYLKLKRSMGASVSLRDNIRACDEVKSPFILGILKPVVYVPSSMTGQALNYVITHETAHIKRCDHWWKPLGYLLLTIYWFNPLCWLAYLLLCRDIEMACDEKVIRNMNKENKAAYSQALLDCSFPRRAIAACPLAFGEVSVKERVKSVLNYKKPAFWIIVVALIAGAAAAICFLTDPVDTNDKIAPPQRTEDGVNTAYRVSSVIYSAAPFDFVVNELNEPQYYIADGKLMWNISENEKKELSFWTEIGTLNDFELDADNFDKLFLYDEMWYTEDKAEQLREKAVHAKRAEAEWNGEKQFFYIIRYKEELLLCRGFYIDDGTPFIRWVQCLTSVDAQEESQPELQFVEHYTENDDGTYTAENGITYQYKLILTGRSPNAVRDSSFIVLSNDKNLTFERVSESLFTSNSNRFLKAEDAVIVIFGDV